jgi:hypothetical protein
MHLWDFDFNSASLFLLQVFFRFFGRCFQNLLRLEELQAGDLGLNVFEGHGARGAVGGRDRRHAMTQTTNSVTCVETKRGRRGARGREGTKKLSVMEERAREHAQHRRCRQRANTQRLLLRPNFGSPLSTLIMYCQTSHHASCEFSNGCDTFLVPPNNFTRPLTQ